MQPLESAGARQVAPFSRQLLGEQEGNDDPDKDHDERAQKWVCPIGDARQVTRVFAPVNQIGANHVVVDELWAVTFCGVQNAVASHICGS